MGEGCTFVVRGKADAAALHDEFEHFCRSKGLCVYDFERQELDEFPPEADIWAVGLCENQPLGDLLFIYPDGLPINGHPPMLPLVQRLQYIQEACGRLLQHTDRLELFLSNDHMCESDVEPQWIEPDHIASALAQAYANAPTWAPVPDVHFVIKAASA